MRLRNLGIILFMLGSVIVMPTTRVQGYYARKWAVIICATDDIQDEAYGIYIVLSMYYNFNGIYYMTNATKTCVLQAFQWLHQHSGWNDLIFIWIGGHGGGFCTYTDGFWIAPNSILGGRASVTWDDKKGAIPPTWSPTFPCIDEGFEVRESEIYHPSIHGLYGLDVNNDGDLNDWVGVDEGIWLEDDGQTYWDDDLRNDLLGLKYNAMVITIVSCFSGGFIDDLSCIASPGRIDPILTSSNETWPTWRKFVGTTVYDMSWWGENYMYALYPHYNRFSEVDADGNGAISVYEAYYWAWLNDPCRQAGQESPWLDDNADRRPTFWMEQDWHGSDGNFSSQIYLHHEP